MHFVCPRSHQTLPLCNECCRRTVQSKQPQLWPKVCHTDLVSRIFFFSLFWALRTHHISPAIPWSLHTHPNQLSRGENAGLGLGASPRIQSSGWLSKRDSSYTTTQNTQLNAYLTMWHLIVSLSIHYSSFLSRLFLSSTMKNAKVPQAEVRISVHYSRNGQKYPDRLSTNSLLKILLEGWAVPGRLLKHRVEFNKVQFGYSWKNKMLEAKLWLLMLPNN